LDLKGRACSIQIRCNSQEEIEMAVGSIRIANKNNQAPEAPGMLSKHYAPKRKLF
jgi:L-threonylcarbamoyladenylate synthase